LKAHQYFEVPIDGELGSYLSCFWWETYCSEKSSPKEHYVVPDNTIELIFTDVPLYREHITKEKRQQLKSHLAGLKTRPQLCTVEKSPLISLRFKAEGLYRFSSLKMKETIDAAFSPEDCFGPAMKELEEALFIVNSQEERMKLLLHFFRKKLRDSLAKADPIFEAIVQEINTLSGIVSVNSLCESYQLSYKKIERKFIRLLGLSPKKYCRLVRTIHCLKEGRNYHLKGHSNVLTQLAYRYSYSDQSHFIKEVKALTSYSPKDFYRLRKGVQAITYGEGEQAISSP
jgi:AraC-like DNA-binding protein